MESTAKTRCHFTLRPTSAGFLLAIFPILAGANTPLNSPATNTSPAVWALLGFLAACGLMAIYMIIRLRKDTDKNNHSKLAASDAAWTHAMEFLDEPLYLLDLNDRIVRGNRAFFEMLKKTPEEAIGEVITGFTHPEGEETPCQICQARIDKRDTVIVQETNDPNNKTGRPREIIIRVVKNNAGQPIGIIQGMHDLTETREHEAELQRQQDKLEELVIKRTADLAIARDVAQEASRAKSAFLANMSHELRTPLNAIIGYSEILMENENNSLDGQDTIDVKRIRSSGQYLLTLIEDVLDLSKIEEGRLELHLSEIDIRRMIDDVVATAYPLINRNNNTLEVICDTNIGSITADPVRLRQCLINLLSNAGKFTKNGSINIIAAEAFKGGIDCLEITVEDTGRGLNKEEIEQLFQPFVQINPSRIDRKDGTGLGLAITRRLCEMMSGKIFVESQPGKGSRFTMCFPRPEAVSIVHPLRH